MNILSFILAASLFIPQGSEIQSRHAPLKIGETAYYDNGNGEAILAVGNGSRKPNKVIDESALRGYRLKSIDRSDFVVVGSANLTHDATKDTWANTSFTKTDTATLTFSVPSHITFEDVKMTAKYTINGGMGSTDAKVVLSRSGNIVTATITLQDIAVAGSTYTLSISDPAVRVLEWGDNSHVNDLVANTFNCKDTLGKLALGKWREWAANLYNGNRGENWADYWATSNVRVGNYLVQFGGTSESPAVSVGTSPENTNRVDVLVSGDTLAKVYYQLGSWTPLPGSELHFSSIDSDVENNVVRFTISYTNLGAFQLDKLRLYVSDTLEVGKTNWRKIDYTLVTASPLVITVPLGAHTERFYKAKYGDSFAVIEITGVTKVHELRIMGTDAKWYRIDITGGVIQAVEITD